MPRSASAALLLAAAVALAAPALAATPPRGELPRLRRLGGGGEDGPPVAPRGLAARAWEEELEVDVSGSLMRRGLGASPGHADRSSAVLAASAGRAARHVRRRRTAAAAHGHGRRRRSHTAAARPAPGPPPPPPGPPALLKWQKHAEKCMTVAGAGIDGANASLVISDCADTANLDNMRFLVPAANTSGQIMWSKDSTKCAYVHNGWHGNGNVLHLWNCDDDSSFQNMNFTNAQFGTTSWLEWTPDRDVLPSKCLDVQQEVLDEQVHDGAKIVLWDLVANTTWVIE